MTVAQELNGGNPLSLSSHQSRLNQPKATRDSQKTSALWQAQGVFGSATHTTCTLRRWHEHRA